MTQQPGTAVVVLTATTVPVSALPLLRTASHVYTHGGVDPALGDGPVPPEVPAGSVILTDDPAFTLTGAPTHRTPGAALIRAAQVMDTLRSPGGCPWDADQTHESLRQYLVEEAYELLDAIDDGDRPALREELGDVLLQVLFHARVASDDTADPFDIDDVATALVDKLVSRHPHVFADGPAVWDAETQQGRWDELKQQEKQRDSSVDGVAMGQPALALAAKLVHRAGKAGFPADLVPEGESVGERLFALAARARVDGRDPEHDLREVARGFADRVRSAEKSVKAAGVELTAEAWRAHWPA
ncbi:MazG family protein [Actinokineospora globicatena]|uniref:MazG family protein n=1 Tax=Actinokineospora globicatena TaxID=103729 RepID=UPI0020A5F0C3|nr:MazG family protein [Actinokineospora globicatena]MCP2300619.1 XTP/dITP diphosphohydrolase [Actinokineospora globicatena]GLW81163.1 nucleoside triphosphate pyrophosphohydrolase [Actinokineospora globicatena]GLW88356.1 nucleoside triphosphate pyrophosphohydrolase [Actinokineospora globicatena]